MDNEFKRGWYLNSEETQERLFELGYKWFSGDKQVVFLDSKYIFTNEDGVLTYSDSVTESTERGTQLDEVDNMKELVTKEELVSALKTIGKLENCKYLSDLQLNNGVLEYLEIDCPYGYDVVYKGDTGNEYTGLDEFLSIVNQDYNKKKELGESLKKLLSEAENIKKQIEEL